MSGNSEKQGISAVDAASSQVMSRPDARAYLCRLLETWATFKSTSEAQSDDATRSRSLESDAFESIHSSNRSRVASQGHRPRRSVLVAALLPARGVGLPAEYATRPGTPLPGGVDVDPAASRGPGWWPIHRRDRPTWIRAKLPPMPSSRLEPAIRRGPPESASTGTTRRHSIVDSRRFRDLLAPTWTMGQWDNGTMVDGRGIKFLDRSSTIDPSTMLDSIIRRGELPAGDSQHHDGERERRPERQDDADGPASHVRLRVCR
jgi:hypothetical protein